MSAAAVQPELETHPLALLFPELPPEEFAELVESIRAEGLRHPIALFEGKILDGRHRYRACQEAGVEPRFEDATGQDAVAIVVAENLRRRHLTEGQRAALVLRLVTMRPPGRPSKTSSVEGVSREGLAKLACVSTGTVDRVLAARSEPDLMAKLEQGAISPLAAEEAARERKRQASEKARATIEDARRYSVSAWKAMVPEQRADALAKVSGNARFNEQTGESIDWAKWSWNPVTGCLHACPYCYARDIAERFYPQKFVPTFLPDRLVAPTNTKVPAKAAQDVSFRNVFTCSMADLFGKWVPKEWIEAVLQQVRAHPEWNFLFLTKFPMRYREFTFPRNAWIGTTVDHQARVAAAERAMAEVDAETKWLSIEPMLTPLEFERLETFQWIVLGGSSASTETPEWRPPIAWWGPLQAEARAKSIAVYHKTNLYGRTIEYPWEPQPVTEPPKMAGYLKSKNRDAVEYGEGDPA
jgi:protein gp37